MTEIAEIKKKIFSALAENEHTPANCKPIYIDGVRYRSLFVAGIDSDISFFWLSKKMAESQGAPVYIKNRLVVFESWVKDHLECLF